MRNDEKDKSFNKQIKGAYSKEREHRSRETCRQKERLNDIPLI